jgi:hypothetical protein
MFRLTYKNNNIVKYDIPLVTEVQESKDSIIIHNNYRKIS